MSPAGMAPMSLSQTSLCRVISKRKQLQHSKYEAYLECIGQMVCHNRWTPSWCQDGVHLGPSHVQGLT